MGPFLASSQSCPSARPASPTDSSPGEAISTVQPGLSIIVGVDTHKDTHVAVAIDSLGRRLAQLEVSTTTRGYRQLHEWALDLGPSAGFGIEGTGSYGAGLTRQLRLAGAHVIEVNRSDRARRHRLGKSDPIDAESAARAILAGVATATPKHGDDQVEMIRILKLTRDSAVKSQTQASNQVHAVLVTAPPELREALQPLRRIDLLHHCAALRPGELSTPTAVSKHALRLLAKRALTLRAEAKSLNAEIDRLTTLTCPALVEMTGIGPDSAAALLISAGDNPQRLRSEAAFAALCGTNPIPASSGKTSRHRLNRGGDRRANAALHRAVVTRMRWHEATKTYVQRRTAEGKTKPEIMRCLKRYLARQVYRALLLDPAVETVVNAGEDTPQAA